MLISTAALYIGVILSSNNSGSTANNTEKQARFQELYSEYQTKVSAQATELSSKYYSSFSPYLKDVKSYNAAAVTELATTDIKTGDGAVITEGSSDYSAYYIGWLSDGTIFDSSFDDTDTPTALKSPLAGGNMIEGWNQGIIDMKIGGVRQISIPSSLGYGSEENGSIPANSPLKFIVMLVPKADEIAWPDEMYKLYSELYGNQGN